MCYEEVIEDDSTFYRIGAQVLYTKADLVGYMVKMLNLAADDVVIMHNAYYTADTNTFKESEYADMAEALNLTLAMPHLIDEALAMQKKAAVAADATDYMEILHL